MSEQTLSEAREWLRGRLDHGAACPCCTQFAKVYRRRLNHVPAAALLALYRDARRDWAHLPTVVKRRLPGVAHQGGYSVLTAHWGLIEEEVEILRDDGGRSGYWRVTGRGEMFVHCEITVPKYARIYDGRCLGCEGDRVSIIDALGARFDYTALMWGPWT